MTGIGWFAAIIVGGLAGWIAEKIMKSDMGLIMNIILGILGALVANWLLMLIVGSTLGGTQEEVLATFSHPAVAILTALVLFVGLEHFRKGAQTMIEDYSQGSARRILIICVTVLSYGATATGLFALAKIAI